jgi:hypothetical protein
VFNPPVRQPVPVPVPPVAVPESDRFGPLKVAGVLFAVVLVLIVLIALGNH